MPEIITLSADQAKIFIEHGSHVLTGGNKYYFLPFWLKKMKDGKFEVHQLGNLPQELTNAISHLREPSKFCDCKKPWGVSGMCVACNRPIHP